MSKTALSQCHTVCPEGTWESQKETEMAEFKFKDTQQLRLRKEKYTQDYQVLILLLLFFVDQEG